MEYWYVGMIGKKGLNQNPILSLESNLPFKIFTNTNQSHHGIKTESTLVCQEIFGGIQKRINRHLLIIRFPK